MIRSRSLPSSLDIKTRIRVENFYGRLHLIKSGSEKGNAMFLLLSSLDIPVQCHDRSMGECMENLAEWQAKGPEPPPRPAPQRNSFPALIIRPILRDNGG